MADNSLYNSLTKAAYAATGGTGAAFENKPDGSAVIHAANDDAWFGRNRLAQSAATGPQASPDTVKTPTTNRNVTTQEKVNTRKFAEDAEAASSKGWDNRTPGYITQGSGPNGKQTWLSRAIGAIARNAEMPDDDNPVATVEGQTPADIHNQKGELLRQEMLASQGKPYYGLGNIDLNSRPMLDNPDGSWSTVDSFSVNIDNKEVLLPTVINYNGQWRHVDVDTAIQHYFDTGEYLGMFDTPEETAAYAKMLHENQEAFYSPRRGRN